MGLDFLDAYRRDSATAWENLMLAVMTNLDKLAESELVTPVRDLINIAKDVEDQVRKGRTVESKGLDGERRLPMDEIGAQWRLELPSATSGSASSAKRTAVGHGKAASNRVVTEQRGLMEKTAPPTESPTS